MLIRDKQIRAFTQNLSQSPQPKIDDDNVLKLLAAVGDGFLRSAQGALAALTRDGITRQEQFDVAREGLSSKERKDIEQILDQSGFDMTPGAKNFLEALVGRAPLDTSDAGPLRLSGDQADGLRGMATPGATIEAINLSTAPSGRLHLTDTVEVSKVDDFGRFAGNLPDLQEGDIVRMRERRTDGSVSDWLTVRARGLAPKDTRNAQVNLERIDLVPHSDGHIDLAQNTARPLSEPGALLRIKNLRSGELLNVTLNDKGALPEGLRMPGKAGDRLEIAISDGQNNRDFLDKAGVIQVPGGQAGGDLVNLDDPAPLKSDLRPDGTSKYALERFTGPLFVDGPAPADVRQGAIGNCYFPAALAAVAHTNPDVIQNLIKENGDGTYSVRFFENTWMSRPKLVEIKVDGDLYSRSWGGPVYGSSLGGSTAKDKMEMWYPLVEKAYAQWQGGYESIGKGGVAGEVMAAVLGRRDAYTHLGNASGDIVFRKLKEAADKGWPACAGTHGKDRADLYTNTGVYANHAYSVLGVEEEQGKRFVKLRNPWGQSEAGHDGKNDGFFRLPLDQFMKLYSNLAIVPA